MALSRRDFLGTAAALGAAGGFARTANAAAPDPTAYKLKPGKPFAGTKITAMVPNAAQYRAQALRLGQLEALTGIKASYTWVPYAQLLDKITIEAVSRSSTYDLVTYQDSWGPSLSNYMEPIDVWLARDRFDFDSYPEVFRVASRFRGVTYGLPVRGQAQLLFYRQDLLKQLGVAAPQTWEEVITISKVLQDRVGIAGIAMDYGKGNGAQNLYTWFNFLWGKGGDLVDAGGQARFNDAAGVDGTQAYLDMLLKHKVANPGSVQFQENDKVNSMAQGKSAMMCGWWWGYPVMIGANGRLSKEQVGFTQIPSFQNGKRVTLGNCMPVSVSKLSRNKEAAWECLKWMANPDLEIETAIDKSKPMNNDMIVTRTASFLNEPVNRANNEIHREGLISLQNARPIPQMRAWPHIAALLESTISELASNRLPVKPALDEIAMHMNRITKKSGDRKT